MIYSSMGLSAREKRKEEKDDLNVLLVEALTRTVNLTRKLRRQTWMIKRCMLDERKTDKVGNIECKR